MPWLDDVSLHRSVFMMFVLRRDWATELVVDSMNRLEPRATWSVDGAPLLVIYRYTPPRNSVSSAPVIPRRREESGWEASS